MTAKEKVLEKGNCIGSGQHKNSSHMDFVTALSEDDITTGYAFRKETIAKAGAAFFEQLRPLLTLSLIHISEPTRH